MNQNKEARPPRGGNRASEYSYRTSKRIFDLVIGSIAFAFTLPFYPFAMLAIFLESGLPVFVELDRVSEGGIVKVYKFRSMVKNAPEMKRELLQFNERKDGPLFKMTRDPRVTKAGKWLRKLRIDEFPQVINVLQGRLALVGPRPHEPEEVAQYPEKYRVITQARGGLTGLSQVRGASLLPFIRELEFDKEYLEHQSVWLDIVILWKTFVIFFSNPTGV